MNPVQRSDDDGARSFWSVIFIGLLDGPHPRNEANDEVYAVIRLLSVPRLCYICVENM